MPVFGGAPGKESRCLPVTARPRRLPTRRLRAHGSLTAATTTGAMIVGKEGETGQPGNRPPRGKRETPALPAAEPAAGRRSAAGRAGTRGSSASNDPLALDPGAFTP